MKLDVYFTRMLQWNFHGFLSFYCPLDLSKHWVEVEVLGLSWIILKSMCCASSALVVLAISSLCDASTMFVLWLWPRGRCRKSADLHVTISDYPSVLSAFNSFHCRYARKLSIVEAVVCYWGRHVWRLCHTHLVLMPDLASVVQYARTL